MEPKVGTEFVPAVTMLIFIILLFIYLFTYLFIYFGRGSPEHRRSFSGSLTYTVLKSNFCVDILGSRLAMVLEGLQKEHWQSAEFMHTPMQHGKNRYVPKSYQKEVEEMLVVPVWKTNWKRESDTFKL